MVKGKKINGSKKSKLKTPMVTTKATIMNGVQKSPFHISLTIKQSPSLKRVSVSAVIKNKNSKSSLKNIPVKCTPAKKQRTLKQSAVDENDDIDFNLNLDFDRCLEDVENDKGEVKEDDEKNEDDKGEEKKENRQAILKQKKPVKTTKKQSVSNAEDSSVETHISKINRLYDINCIKCGKDGHESMQCKTHVKGQKICFKCGKIGHMSRQCKTHVDGDKTCLKCGKEEFVSMQCRTNVADDQRKNCFICNEVGHIARQCTSRVGVQKCYQCGGVGHQSIECPSGKKRKRCFKCGEAGHIFKYCTKEHANVMRSPKSET